ncbi:MAG: hypothetical protein ABIS47_08190, partial [Acidimicrobiales bacterium]
VVAADRLRDLGWVPSHTVEEAIVATTRCTTIASLSPRRRQEVMFGLAGAGSVGAALMLATLVRRALRPSRRRSNS